MLCTCVSVYFYVYRLLLECIDTKQNGALDTPASVNSGHTSLNEVMICVGVLLLYVYK